MLARILVYGVLFLPASFAQSPPTQAEGPRFDVVSIKLIPTPAPGDGTPYGLTVSAARVQGVNQLFSLLTRAFRVEAPQLVVPDFAHSEFFQIQATLPAGATADQVPEMLQRMLSERFKLVYHRETRSYQANVVTIGKDGMKLPRLPDGTPIVLTRRTLADGTTRITQTGRLPVFFPAMNSFGGLNLVDETGLDGTYTWVQDERPPAPGANPQVDLQERLQDSFTAMIEAAGLKLETRKVPKETIVVDHIEKMPVEN